MNVEAVRLQHKPFLRLLIPTDRLRSHNYESTVASGASEQVRPSSLSEHRPKATPVEMATGISKCHRLWAKQNPTSIQTVQIKHPNCYRKVVYFICKLCISGRQRHSIIVYEAPTHRIAFYLCADTVRTEIAICADKCFGDFELQKNGIWLKCLLSLLSLLL